MAKTKYNVGDRIGPSDNLLISKEQKITSGGNKKWVGTFECSHPQCSETFDADIGKVTQGKRKYCSKHAKDSIVHPRKYNVGDKIGSKHIEILDLDYSNPKDPFAEFSCPNDGNVFKARLYAVANGSHPGICEDCAFENKLKYKDGDYIGDQGLKLLHRCSENIQRGVFLCTCGNTFERSIQSVASNETRSCDECRLKRYTEERTDKAQSSPYKIGDRIGDNQIELIAFDHHEMRKGWFGEFQCPFPGCKNTFVAQISQVANNRRKTCGEHQQEIHAEATKKNILDLTEMTFGRLTAIERLDEKDPVSGSYIWICLCECQKDLPEQKRRYTYRSASYLVSAEKTGRRQSCGCWGKELSAENGRNNVKDLSGQIFGYLEPLYQDGFVERGTQKMHSVTWTCHCHNCGSTVEHVAAADLTSGNRISCGKCQVSNGELSIQNALKELGIEYDTHKTFDNCRNPETNYRLIFDFYLPREEVLIEFDGIQHYKKDDRISIEDFHKANTRDVIKNSWAAQNKIPLIRIPYTSLEDIDAAFVRTLIDQAIMTRQNIFIPIPPDTPDDRPHKF